MLRSYFTLYHIADELHERLAGGYLFEIHSQQKNEVMLAFVTPDGRHEQLVVTVRSPHFSLHMQEGLNRKRRNTAGLMKEVYERQVTGVAISPADRQISFELDDGHAIVLRMFSAETNVLLVRDGKIVETFKEGRKLENTPFEETSADIPYFRALETLANDPELFVRKLKEAGEDEPLDRRLLTALPGFDRKLVRRLLDVAESKEPEQLHRTFVALFYDLTSPAPCVIERLGEPPRFSLFEPLDDGPFTPFESVLDAINHYSRKMYRHLRQQEKVTSVKRELSAKIGKIEKELASADKHDPEELAQQYETYGHLLTGAIGTAEPSGDSITVPNLFDPGSSDVTIPLKPRINLQENAAWYFTQATKNRKRIQANKLRHAELNRELDDLRQKLQALDHATGSPESLRRLLETSGSKSDKDQHRKQEKKHPFRAIPLGPNINLYIGKSAANNEKLTFGFAKPNDIWLHARGASGSHCVLKGAGMHNLSEIQRAAEIAAWHSSAKHSELVPVMYTEKKYVKKDRKSPGSVILEREKVVMVKPMKE
ncbi:protein of unknown function DUF814 [Chlorobaculum parvum NCIB 8327]|uniref:NFACT RNA-binding domain-containing protein n=1 Tax=Chlorobaculum parvum (strain DSM 263 / NCIMB 8327) TaxID=517417 RepID=B3QMH5_CHLP8|nr:NFACT RNA binding domain-containing protein [Chlorobaculum parvum]ACF11128.1 protein of unknown function DUF814 [Chlorobaculum parvum NCIB 8327]